AFDAVVVATGVTPRAVRFPGSDHARVLSYLAVLRDSKPVGGRVAIIGAGGIGFDMVEFLVEDAPSPTTDVQRWATEWGVDLSLEHRGGLIPPRPAAPERQVWLLQRSEGRLGARLNKTSGWVHRATVKAKRVTQLGGVRYEHFDDAGLHI